MDDDMHWRLYDHPEQGRIVVCVQWFDYYGYDESRFVGPRFASEAEAKSFAWATSGSTSLVFDYARDLSPDV